MRIAYLSYSIIPSRQANSIHVMKMCQAFNENGHSIVLYTPENNHLHEPGIQDIYSYYNVYKKFRIERVYTSRFKGKTIIYIINLFRKLKSENVDLVYGRDLLGCAVSILLGIRTIYETHDPFWKYSRINRAILRLLVLSKHFQKMVVITDALRDLYVIDTSLYINEIRVAPDGADIVNSMNDKISLQGDTQHLKIGYTGHLYKGRGIDLILELAQQLHEHDFHIVGGTEADIEYWKNNVKSRKISNIYFYGHVSPKDAILYRNSFDVLLAPYAKVVQIGAIKGYQGNTSAYMSPIKIFEYMAHQKPIIASSLPVIKEVLNERDVVFAFPEDTVSWVSAIRKLENKKTRLTYAMSAYNKFVSNYTWKQRAKNVLV
jgi:glycosyltransferase involved in cell wall biosynthesis